MDVFAQACGDLIFFPHLSQRPCHHGTPFDVVLLGVARYQVVGASIDLANQCRDAHSFQFPNQQTRQDLRARADDFDQKTEGVEEIRKVERCVKDRVQTMTSANETWCARMMNSSLNGHIMCFTFSLRRSLEPHARKCCVCGAVYCLHHHDCRAEGECRPA